MYYWVCPKGKRNKHGEIVSDFKTMMHYYFLFSGGNNDAEIYSIGSDQNIAESFLEIYHKYRDARDKIEKDCVDKLRIPFEVNDNN